MMTLRCARINHSCRPKCYAAWDPSRGRQTVHALRPIKSGEELGLVTRDTYTWP